MSQANAGDFPIDPQVTSGTQLAEILNRFYNATNTQNSGATEPPVTYPGMFWYDTSVTPPVLKIRNSGNSGWVDFADSIALTPGDITGLGTMATVNSPAPIANGGTGATTAAAARTNLGLDATYVNVTGDTMTGELYATVLGLDANASFKQDASNVYLQAKTGVYLAWAKTTGALTYSNGVLGKTTSIHNAAGDFISAGNVFTGGDNGVALVGVGARYLRFTNDGWRWEWSNGSLFYISSGGQQLAYIDSSGYVNALQGMVARGGGAVGLNCLSYADWGGGVLGREIVQASPGWSNVHIQAIHYQGSWAGFRFAADGNGYVDFVLSSSPVQIRNANIEGRANTAGYSDNTGSMAGKPSTGWIHNNDSAVRYIRNEGAHAFIGFIDGYGEVNWPVGPSDERLKANIKPTTQDSLAIINQLEFIQYNFKPIHSDVTGEDFHIDDEHLHELGLRAQQAQAIDSELVSSLGTYLQLNPTEVALLALHGVKQLLARVAALEAA